MRNYLDEIVAMLPTEPAQQDALVSEFYQRLLAAAPHLKPLFPRDLVSGDALNSKGHRQRDVLFAALAELLTRYDPDDRDSENMQALDTALLSMGHTHANFDRQDGTRSGATVDEYLAVRNVLLRLLQDALGDRWEPVHTTALVGTFGYAMVEMLHSAQHYEPAAYGRQPRADA
jgi:hemoglobin-like flavoprotein